MSTQGVVIRFEGPEAWEEHNEHIKKLRAETITELTALGGVFVDIVGEE
ncbi:hypothetical protein PENFLA_c001G09777 [Penicillium flavigenum]|uniref:Uncharacterized protein n=1 Tax=Penicillium flavigenum TaxID=254877 RepID=A0A1V6U2V6_9EURO|nr:hypothetical protein PENFLA_c001G09777 [Penicillium flavigenum]